MSTPATAFDWTLFDGTPAARQRMRRDDQRRARAALRETRGKFLAPPPNLTVPDWADANLEMPEDSPTPGPYRTERFEVSRGPMLAWSEPGVRSIVGMAASQVWKTTLLLNVIGAVAHLNPGRMMMVRPKEQEAREFSAERIQPMFRDTKALANIMAARKGRKGAARKRDPDNKALKIVFIGGYLFLVSAQSPSDLASRSVPYLFFDEVDRFPPSAGKEGDPISLAERRSANYYGARSVKVSSPGLAGQSRIQRDWDGSDQRKPFIECPCCGVWQILKWGDQTSRGGVKWQDDAEGNPDPTTAYYECEACGEPWAEDRRLASLTTRGAVRWKQCRPFTCCGVAQNPEAEHRDNTGVARWEWDGWVWRSVCRECGRQAVPNKDAGFWSSRLYAPPVTVQDAVDEWKKKRLHPQDRVTFINTFLGLPYEDVSEAVDAGDLEGRAVDYPAPVPRYVSGIYAGIDIQENRIEVTLLGVGPGDEFWVLSHHILDGRTFDGRKGAESITTSVWDQLEALLLTRWEREDGLSFGIEAACIDSGGRRTTKAVYSFVRRFRDRHGDRPLVMAVKGKSDRPGERSPIWPKKPVLRERGRVTVYPIGVTQAKWDLLKGYLHTSEPGPGYVHFPTGLGKQYYDQLTAERLVTTVAPGGQEVQVWDAGDRRNEALDCWIYAYAAYNAWMALGLTMERRAKELRTPKRTRAVAPAEPAPAEEPTIPVPAVPASAGSRISAELPRSVGNNGQQAPRQPTPPPATPPRPPRPPEQPQGWMQARGPRRRWL